MGKIIGITSIKGGVGKTTMVVNLANTLAKVYKKRVLVVDANFSAPNLRLYLGLEEPKVGIHEVLQEIVEPIDAVYDTSYKFHILPARLNNKHKIQASHLGKFLDRLRPNYDFILLDTSPNVNAEIISAISASDELFLIVNPDYANMSCILKAMHLSNEEGGVIAGIIANKVYNTKNEISLNEIESITGSMVIGTIPHHLDIHESVLGMKPVELNSRKKYSQELSEIAKLIILSEDFSSSLKLKNNIFKTVAQKNREAIVNNVSKTKSLWKK